MSVGRPPRAVFDCMTFLQGAARPNGPAGACVAMVDADEVELQLSPAVLREVREVLLRPSLRRKFPILTPDFVDGFLDGLTDRATVHEDVPAVIDLPRDPKDEPYVNLALASAADYLVTRDRDLLDLHDERLAGVEIVDPVQFLRAVRSE